MKDELNQKTKALVEKNPKQMTENEYKKIAEVLTKKAPCKLLVFGCGIDCEL